MRILSFLTGIFFLIVACCSTALAQEKGGTNRPMRLQDQKPAKGKKQDSKKKSTPNRNNAQNQADDSSQVAASQQQAAADQALQSYLTSTRRQRLGRVPRMFGDWFGPGIRITTVSETPGPTNGIFTAFDLPQIVRVGKISENNNALPVDRAYFNFNYFNQVGNNAAIGPDTQSAIGSSSVARYTLGLERTFFDGLTSLEARFVMGDVTDFGHSPAGPGALGFQTYSPTMGNLSVISKFLLYEDDSTALAAGLGIEFPTGGDTLVQSGSSVLNIRNNASYLTPYLGLLKKPVDSPWFANAFVQVEVPTWGDRVFLTETANGSSTRVGIYTPQTAVFVDVGIGRWLAQNPGGVVTGIAGFVEAHYNASLNDADQMSESVNAGPLSSTVNLNPGVGNFEVVDITAGLHFEFGQQAKLRIGGIVPVSSDKPFDSEFGLQWTQYR